MAFLQFQAWVDLREMASRRSFARTMGKFLPHGMSRPVAVLTAFRGDIPGDDAEKLSRNRAANERLKRSFSRLGLSFYPVIGMGQEPDKETERYSREESFVVQPARRDVDEEAFVAAIQELLFNPVASPGSGPFSHTQWGALVKLPSQPEAFLLNHGEEAPGSARDYTRRDAIGLVVRPRRGKPTDQGAPDHYFAQMAGGPRASDTMKSGPDVGALPGRRFTVGGG